MLESNVVSLMGEKKYGAGSGHVAGGKGRAVDKPLHIRRVPVRLVRATSSRARLSRDQRLTTRMMVSWSRDLVFNEGIIIELTLPIKRRKADTIC